MLSRNLYETLGRPKGSHLSSLPQELRNILSRYATSCDYHVEMLNHVNKTILLFSHWWISHLVTTGLSASTTSIIYIDRLYF